MARFHAFPLQIGNSWLIRSNYSILLIYILSFYCWQLEGVDELKQIIQPCIQPPPLVMSTDPLAPQGLLKRPIARWCGTSECARIWAL